MQPKKDPKKMYEYPNDFLMDQEQGELTLALDKWKNIVFIWFPKVSHIVTAYILIVSNNNIVRTTSKNW